MDKIQVKEISVKDLALGLLTLRGDDLTPDAISKERLNIRTRLKNQNLPYREDSSHKVGFLVSEETVLSLIRLSRAKNKSLRDTTWEELLKAITKGKSELEEQKEKTKSESKETKYSYWHLQLKDLIEPLMREGKSIRQPLEDYYWELIGKIRTIEAIPTALMILVKHRKYLEQAVLIATKNKWRKSLITQSISEKEWNPYEKDLEEARWIFKDPEDMKQATRNRQNKSLERRHGNLTQLPYTLNEFKKKLDTLFKSYDVRDHILGAMLATGRRWEEIEEKGEFRTPTEEEIRGSDFPDLDVKTAFYIKGLAKKKEEDVEGVFPSLYDPKRVILAIESLREMSIKKVSFIKFVLKEHPEIGSKLHDTRRFYARFSYRLFNNNKNYSPLLWVKRVLGHESDNWTSLLSYMTHSDKEDS